MSRSGPFRTPRRSYALALLVLFAGACGKESSSGGPSGGSGASGAGTNAKSESAASSASTILIGEYGSMTGSEANFGRSTHNGLMLAVEEQNALGGIKGKKIEVHSLDDRGSGQEVGTVVTRLIQNDKVLALIGEVASSLSITGGEIAQKNHVPMISPSSTNPHVTQIGDMIFRVCFLDDFQGYVDAKFLRENLKVTRAATLYDQGQSYSKGLSQYFTKSFKEMGGTITTEQAYTGGDQDFSAQLTTIRGSNPEAIFIPGYYTDAANIAIQVRKLGIKVPLMGGDGWDSPQLAEIGKDAIEGAYYSNHYTHEDPNPVVQKFVKGYKEKNNGLLPDGIAALGYDATRLLFDAMQRSSSYDGRSLAAAIAATKDFQGVTGMISIDAGRNAKKSAVVVQMKGGIPHLAATIAPVQ
jgi:branched-chain amino acid transport system substrate-binding protein